MILPICETFKIENNYYIFDTYTNEYILVPKAAYDYLNAAKKECEIGSIIPEKINEKYKRGHLFLEELKKINDEILGGYNFGKTKYYYDKNNLKDVCENRLSQLILEVTTGCNLRCKYCINSKMYRKKEIYPNKYMTEEIMKKSIDFFLENSKENDEIYISFYGGEPLLNFNIIKKAVEYIKNKVIRKKVFFNMTTNGILLTQEIIGFLVNEDFNILISLDGPKLLHDAGRIDINGKPTYDKVIKNLQYIKENHPEFFSKVSFNSVIPGLKFQKVVEEYFCKEFPNNGQTYSDLVDGAKAEYLEKYFESIDNINEINNKNQQIEVSSARRYLDYLITNDNNELNDHKISAFDKIYAPYFQNSIIELKNDGEFWPSGCCSLVQRRLYVTVDGEFYPCEKVDTKNNRFLIGDIEQGINYKKLQKFIDDYTSTLNKCNKCWAVRHCSKCWKKIDSFDCNYQRKLVYDRMKKVLEVLQKNPYASVRFDKIILH